MSLLPPDVHAELTQLLQALQSADNSIRSQAEEHLQNNWTSPRPEVLLMGLAEQIQAAPETSVGCRFCRIPLPASFERCISDRLCFAWPPSPAADPSLLLDALLCRRHLPSHRLKDAQVGQERKCRHVHLPV
jgi:hypothetical protein